MTRLQAAIQGGLRPLRASEPLRLSEWAAENFYLSAESSYLEQSWVAYPYQVAIMDAISNDAVEEVVLRKSARVGYTKILLAAIAYFAEHRHRNQALWQPTDEDSDEFVKTELEPMIRDVPAMQRAFPDFQARNKANTLRQKSFIGCMLHLRGGKAAKNYRRLSVSVAMLDEIDAFDFDIESEGSPYSLAKKRTEGATFPKIVVGSAPKLKNYSHVDNRERDADMRLTFRIPCPCCGELRALRWGGRDEPFGFKWTDDNPETVRHLCEGCGGFFTQSEYLEVWALGRWMADDGTWVDDADGTFRNADGEAVAPPRSVAFHVWTAYSPQASWAQIVREFLAAKRKSDAGDDSELKTFVNTTLGESWEEGGAQAKADALQRRAEPFPLGEVPEGGIILTMSVDVQGDRLEWLIRAWGAFEESWPVGYETIWGDPATPDPWVELKHVIETPIAHVNGALVRVVAVAVDSGGHHTHEVYQFCRSMGRYVFAVKGHSQRGRDIIGKPTVIDVNSRGEKLKRGAQLWMLGTDKAKDLIHGRLHVKQPGPGFIHFSDDLPIEYYEQLASEKRIPRYVKGRMVSEWVKPSGARNEALDLEVYALAAAHKIGIHRWKAPRWAQEAKRIAPKSTQTAAPVPATAMRRVGRIGQLRT